MSLKYYKLFDLLTRYELKKTDLLDIMSSSTLAKISKGEDISTKTIEAICSFLNCQPKDIMEYERNVKDENSDNYFTVVVNDVYHPDECELIPHDPHFTGEATVKFEFFNGTVTAWSNFIDGKELYECDEESYQEMIDRINKHLPYKDILERPSVIYKGKRLIS